jgi:hypothetical protein
MPDVVPVTSATDECKAGNEPRRRPSARCALCRSRWRSFLLLSDPVTEIATAAAILILGLKLGPPRLGATPQGLGLSAGAARVSGIEV